MKMPKKSEILADLMDKHGETIAKTTGWKISTITQAAQWLRNDRKKILADGKAVNNVACMFAWIEAPQTKDFWGAIDNYFVVESGPNYLKRGS